MKSRVMKDGEFIPMAVTTVLSSAPRSFDDRGRALSLTLEDIDQRARIAIQALDSLDDMGDENEQRETLAYLTRAVDED